MSCLRCENFFPGCAKSYDAMYPKNCLSNTSVVHLGAEAAPGISITTLRIILFTSLVFLGIFNIGSYFSGLHGWAPGLVWSCRIAAALSGGVAISCVMVLDCVFHMFREYKAEDMETIVDKDNITHYHIGKMNFAKTVEPSETQEIIGIHSDE